MDIWSILNVNILHKIMFWNKRVIHCSNCMLMTKFNGWIGSTSATPLLYIYYYYIIDAKLGLYPYYAILVTISVSMVQCIKKILE